MHAIRAFLSTLVGVTVTGFAFVMAAAFSFFVIAAVGFAAVAGLAVVKLAPLVRAASVRFQLGTRAAWQGGRQALSRA